MGEVKLSNAALKERLGIHMQRQVSRTTLLGITALKEALAPIPHLSAQHWPGLWDDGGGMDITEEAYPDAMTGKIIAQHDCGGNTNEISRLFWLLRFHDDLIHCMQFCSQCHHLWVRLIQSGLRVDDGCGRYGVRCHGFNLKWFQSLMILDELAL